MTKTFALLCIVLVSGCAHVDPYAEIGVGVTIDKMTDYWLQTSRDWTCSTPQAHIEVGIEYERWQLGYHHQSNWLCGGPFNDKPEVYQDEIILNYKFGGTK